MHVAASETTSEEEMPSFMTDAAAATPHKADDTPTEDSQSARSLSGESALSTPEATATAQQQQQQQQQPVAAAVAAAVEVERRVAPTWLEGSDGGSDDASDAGGLTEDQRLDVLEVLLDAVYHGRYQGSFYETAMRQPPAAVARLLERALDDAAPLLPAHEAALCCEAVCSLLRTYPSAHDQGLLPGAFLAQWLADKKGKPLDRTDAAKAAESALFTSLADAAHDFWQVRWRAYSPPPSSLSPCTPRARAVRPRGFTDARGRRGWIRRCCWCTWRTW
jgi:hypothetical protein